MLLSDIIALLQQNNAKTSDFFTVSELRALVAQASVDVVGAAPNAVTLLYSGNMSADGTGHMLDEMIVEGDVL